MIELDLSSPVGTGADPTLLRMNTIREYSADGTGYLIEHIAGRGFRFVHIEQNAATGEGKFGATLGYALASARADWAQTTLPRGNWVNLLQSDSVRQDRFESDPLFYRAAKHFHSTVDQLIGDNLVYLVQKDATTGLFHFISIDGTLEEDFHSPELSSLRELYREMAQHAKDSFELSRYRAIHFKLFDRENIPEHIPAEEWLAINGLLSKFPELGERSDEVARVVRYIAKLLPGKSV